MNILALSTAEPDCSLALEIEGQLVYEEFWKSPKTHSKGVMTMISHLFDNRCDLGIGDIDLFVAARGPGSFTGLRIGISTMLGLSSAMSRPAAGVSSLDGIAFQFPAVRGRVCAMMDARRSQVYAAVYRFEQGGLLSRSEETACTVEEIVEKAGSPCVYAGSGALAFKDSILELTDRQAVIAEPCQSHVKASALILSARRDPDMLSMPDAALTPVYLRQSDAQVKLESSVLSRRQS